MRGEKEITATFDGDTKRMHRYTIDAGQELAGMIYFLKGFPIPESITIRLRTRAEVENENKGS